MRICLRVAPRAASGHVPKGGLAKVVTGAPLKPYKAGVVHRPTGPFCHGTTPLADPRGDVLSAVGLAAFRGERLVFSELGFAVPEGGALLLTGPNGAGKSTLLRVLAGLGRAEAGQVLWHGQNALDDLAAHANRIAYLGHLDAIKPGLTAAENLRFGAAPGAIAPALDAVGLASLADLPARMLSAGQKRRLALARLVTRAAPIWLLDEPTLGVDAASVTRLAAMLATHRAGGGVVVAATHLPLPLPGAMELQLSGTQTAFAA
jgi:heme exporter protein A